jgi:polyhydroxyalkanoate synthase subunit PhaC
VDIKDKNNPTILMDAIVDAYASSLQFCSRLNRSFLDALLVPFTDARDELREIKTEEAKKEEKVYPANLNDYLNYQQRYYQKYEKVIMSGIRDKFDINFREEGFTRSLSEYIDCYSDIAKMTGFGQDKSWEKKGGNTIQRYQCIRALCLTSFNINNPYSA